MDVTANRDVDEIIVLGSGTSILALSDEEIAYINRCKTVIAMNKFMVYYKLSKIVPTHVYFVDWHGNSLLFLKHILKMSKSDGLKGLTFILNKTIWIRTYTNPLKRIFGRMVLAGYYAMRYVRRFRKEFLDNVISDNRFLPVSKANKLEFVKVTLSYKAVEWVKTTKGKLFHFRGSLSSVLNYCSIKFPNTKIQLVGTDFNGPNYFYEKELDQLDFEWKDYTYQKVKKEKRHLSFHKFDGKNLSDVFPFIIEELAKTGNAISCNNPESLLVTESGVDYKKLIQD